MVLVMAVPWTRPRVIVTLVAPVPVVGKLSVHGPRTARILLNVAGVKTAVSPAVCPAAIRKYSTGKPPSFSAFPFRPVMERVMLVIFVTATEAIFLLLS
jgi:hypothetical protein